MLSTGLLSAVMGMKLPGDGTILMEETSKFRQPVFLEIPDSRNYFTGCEEERMFYIGTFQESVEIRMGTL